MNPYLAAARLFFVSFFIVASIGATDALGGLRTNSVSLFAPDLVDGFQDLSVGQLPGILVRDGFSIGESFAGQTVDGGNGAGFETIVGAPTVPLQLNTPTAGDGLYVSEAINGNRTLAGLANGITNDDIGEGAISFLFDHPARAFALSFNSDDDDAIWLVAFARDGSVVDSLFVPRSLRPISFISDNVGVQGISITNVDELGITVDFLQLIHVPEPCTLLFAGVAGLGLLAFRRR
jgi:hypothetical protein